jgi:hypothetical protein
VFNRLPRYGKELALNTLDCLDQTIINKPASKESRGTTGVVQAASSNTSNVCVAVFSIAHCALCPCAAQKGWEAAVHLSTKRSGWVQCIEVLHSAAVADNTLHTAKVSLQHRVRHRQQDQHQEYLWWVCLHSA